MTSLTDSEIAPPQPLVNAAQVKLILAFLSALEKHQYVARAHVALFCGVSITAVATVSCEVGR